MSGRRGLREATDTSSSTFTPGRVPVWGWAVVVGALWLTLHVTGALPGGSGTTLVVFCLATMVVVGRTFARERPQPAWPWVGAGISITLWLVGGMLREGLGTLGDLGPHRSLVPDVVTLLGYGAAALGAAGLVGARARRHDIDAFLDAAIAGLAALTVAWNYLLGPALAQTHTPLPTRVVLGAYVVASVFLVVMAARLAFTAGRRPSPALVLLLAALVLLLVGDTVYLLVDAHLAVVAVTWRDVPYGLAYVLFAAAALHPTARALSRPSPVADGVPRRARLLFVASAMCVPAVAFASLSEATGNQHLVLAVCIFALTAVCAIRMFRALREYAHSQTRLAHQANHDPLTGLPNRLAIVRHLDYLIQASGGQKRPAAVLFLDLDRFKLVNDTLGHQFGDALLSAVARRLSAGARPSDMIGRIGGDEFVIVASEVRSRDHACELAERIRLKLATPFTVLGAEIATSASVGVVVRDGAAKHGAAESMLRDADTAMYRAKDGGGNAVVVFDHSMHKRLARRLVLEQDLRSALDRDQLRVEYQPVVNLADERVVGLEALIRWTHPELGEISPAEFIPIAEEYGSIVEIGAWVLEQVCASLAAVRGEFGWRGEFTMSVNVSARQLRNVDVLRSRIAASLMHHGLPASSLCLELTESLLMSDIDGFIDQLARLRATGVHAAIDDFGTGYSSLAYLRRLPVNQLKVDRSFVKDVTSAGADASLVAAIVAMARSLGMKTVAEGVETVEQARCLRELGCDQAQGCLYALPQPVAELGDTLRRLGLTPPPRLRLVGRSA